MKRAGLFFLIYTLLSSLILNAQTIDKKPLTINDFAAWKVVNNPIVSNDGKLAAFEINPQKGNGNLLVKTIDSKKEDTLSRGYAASFSPESDFIVYKIKQPEDSIRSAKKKKLKKEQMPKDSLGILVFKHHKVYKFPNLKQFTISKENARWVAFLTDMKKKDPSAGVNAENKVDQSKAKKETEPSTDTKSQLVLFHVASGDTVCFQNVTEYYYAPQGHSITFIRQTKDSLDHTEVVVFDTDKRKTDIIFKQAGTSKNITSDKEGGRFGFLFSADTIYEKVYSLYYGSLTTGEPQAVVIPDGQGMPLGWSPSEFADLSFSENGQYLYLGTNRKPQAELKDTLLDEEKPVLDIWNWKDKELQPEQKVNLEKERKRTYLSVYLIDKARFIQLGDPVVREVQTIQKGNGHVALGIDDSSYKRESSWTGKSAADYYLIDIETGIKRAIVQDKSLVSLSPGGNFIVWYDPADSSYYSRSTNVGSNDIIKLTSEIPVSFCDEIWDMPEDSKPYGIAGWSENDKYMFLYDRYDMWRVDMEGAKVPVNATRNYGRKNFLPLRYCKLNPEEEFIDTGKPIIVSAFDERSKSDGYFSADIRNYSDPRLLLMEDCQFNKLSKAKNAEVLIWTRENVSETPDVWSGNLAFDHRHQLSMANPQQKMFVWPGVRLVHWDSFSGKKLEGLLYFPETIDPDRKYPMIVYFYERSADNMNAYISPSPSRSTVNRTYYASNDYIIFVPDITYEDGYPGQSAFDAVVSGTQIVSSMFPFIDRNKIGIQGQSWGGYQTAWLITQTDMFAAAMAGAPVSNMTSAYGGIRWESGMSRMFQYEKSQSRIGGTLWDKPLQYIENSPLFYVPKIKTPLLIMHNDNDGAVPWYQGIELFTAMRRLNKPAWMLTYNNEEHNLKAESWANRMDLTIRMKQFFDHYLKGEPMPPWMRYGIPAIKKGKELGY
ncbi:MAG TPA: prolyl oligopeptidase family serine peptidase [Prolixibacteraceae bacterium]|nr:prolyl oligopeptidase family serine peptidase [Prolixibacteraceae bacterium]